MLSPAASGLVHADKDESTPNATTTYLNYAAGSNQSTSATLAVASDGKIQVEASSATNMLIDVQGYYTAGDPAAGGYVPVTPTRLVDTRNGTGLPQAALSGGSTTLIQVGGHAGVPVGASAVMVNVTVINSDTSAHLFEAYPADTTRPSSTSVNIPAGPVDYAVGQQIGLSSASPAGAFDFYISGGSGVTYQLVVDVVGYFTPSSSSGAFTPAATRVYDSRTSGHTTLGAGATATIPVAGVAGVPVEGSGISAVTTNVAVIDPGTTATNNWIEVWASGTTRPNPGSSLNFQSSAVTSNMVTSALGADGAVQVFNDSATAINVVVDVEGWYTDTGSPVPTDQDQTSQSVTLQADPSAGGSWVTYQYRDGASGAFSNVPVGDVTDSGGNHPSAWPVQKGSTAFTAYTWNLRNTLTPASGPAPDALIQVQACYGSSATDTSTACGAVADVSFSQTGLGAATDDAGPGTVALQTGDYEIDATDATAASSLAGLSVGRSLTTLAPADAGLTASQQRSDATGVFGPGWTSDLASSDAGDADLTVAKDGSGYLDFAEPDGSSDTYQATSSTSSYPVSYTGVGDNTGDGETVVKVNASTITMTDPDTTVTTWTKTGSSWRVAGVAQPGSNSTTSYTYNAAGLPTRILAPVPAGVTCTSPDATPGCRSLLLTYETVTVSGTSVTRLQNVATSLPQTAGTANKTTVAAYDYTAGGLLADEYDPRISPSLRTAYTYNTNGRLATLTSPGLAAYSFTYDSHGRLSTISRPGPTSGTATSTIVYDVPLSGSGLPDLSNDSTGTGTWDETGDLPVTGTAVFDPDHNPAGSTASTVSSSDWPYAAISYLDVNGAQVNTAGYGAGAWQIDTTKYDANGNDVWDLTAGNRAQALTTISDTDPYVAGLANSYDRANLLASTSVYNPLDPGEVTDTYGPTHPVTLHDGTVIDARTHVNTVYDEGAPNSDVNPATNAAYDLPTTVTTTGYNVVAATDTGYPDDQVTRSGYAPVDPGDTDGWTLGQATTSTVQMGASPSAANDLVTTTRYDANGRTIETRLPGGASGATAQSTVTSFYTATGTGSCVSATMAGLVCSTAPAAQPSSGDPLPVTTYSYDAYGDPTSKTETYGTGASQVVRTTATGYDAAQRETSSSLTVTPTSAGGTPVPAVAYGYDTATGLPITATTGTGPDIQTLTTGYDRLGETTSYTDATGNTSSTSYDLAGNVTSVNDGKGTTTYTIDSSTEHRGLVTSEDIGVTGAPSTFTASYDPDGTLSSETYPNGLVATTSVDNAGEATQLQYAKDGSTWMTFTQASNPLGQIVTQSSPQSNQTFGYDPDDRLTTVQDSVDQTGGGTSCITRAYSFDQDSNRTALKSYPAASGGTCSTGTTPVATGYSYDQADRLTSDAAGSYAYDALGRSTTVPSGDAQGIGSHASTTGALTIGYYANDMVATQTQGSATENFTLDPDQNRIATQTDGTTTTTDHYTSDGDSPAWTGTGTSTWTRNLAGPGGNLAATTDQTGTLTLQLANLHGDIVATCADTTSASGVSGYQESTEYGIPRDPAHAPDTYGYLGTNQRSTNDLAGLTLMGVRLYNPTTGAFESPDPLPGGNSNAYAYPTDPIGSVDTTGKYKRTCGFVTCTLWMSHGETRAIAEWGVAGALAAAIEIPFPLSLIFIAYAAYLDHAAWHAYDGRRDLYIKYIRGTLIAVKAGSYCGAYYRNRHYCR